MTCGPAARVVGLYDRHAEAWAAARGTVLPEHGWFDRFVALLPPGADVLDLGCGPGVPVARHLAGRGCVVTGVDSSPRMLALARAAAPGGAWVLADMRGLALGHRFAGIVAWDSFFHLCEGDQRAMFAVFAAHAAPGAALMFTAGPRAGVAMGEFGGEPLFHASLDPAEYRALLAAHGFAVRAHVAEDPSAGGRMVWLAQHLTCGAAAPS